jgi:hypothetical protein
MATETVKTRAPKKERDIEVQYDFGANLEEAKALFGETAVFDGYKSDAKISLQAVIRDMLGADKSDDEIKTFVSTWKYGVARDRVVDPVAAIKNKMVGMSEEEKREFIQSLLV